EAGLLAPEEVATLEASWRKRFDHTNEPDWVGHCIGHAKPGDTFATWLHGAEGRRAYYRWAGIPKALVKRWTKERKRRSKTIRRLAKPAHPKPAAQEACAEPATEEAPSRRQTTRR